MCSFTISLHRRRGLAYAVISIEGCGIQLDNGNRLTDSHIIDNIVLLDDVALQLDYVLWEH